ncbi:hypothetical protein EH31_16490 [Erythrobacter longus]|uniref:TonB C-terminal domain-containing protein n=1 Tax=Erythrobacter longus TaxID=1044 RepID=A0A074MSF9_ERYLO|nr:TonB family protein [Erythrobacter longus]KEO88557.1 hypothetical protein EH31_16490 [Erythrobacter longus]
MIDHRSNPNQSLKLCLKAFGMAALACASAPVVAMQQSGEETFVDLGRWVVVQNENARTCELRLTNHPQVVLRYSMADGRAGVLALQRKSGSFFTGMVGDVTWAFDEARFGGYQSGNGYSLSASTSDVEVAFRSARTLYVDHGGNQLARIDLTTSSAGFRLLKQCAEQWRYIPWYRRLAGANTRDLDAPSSRSSSRSSTGTGTVPSAPSRSQPSRQPSSQPSRRGGVAPPLDRPTLLAPVSARPINPAGWIGSDDTLPWPSRGFKSGQGVLRYTLLVNEEGRAEECEVDRSTGSRRFDREACRILMDRARFEPARGSDGSVAKARYTASVRFAGE